MIRPLALSALLLASGALGAGAQLRIQLADSGRGLAPRILSAALAEPHDVIGPDSAPAVLARGTHHARSVIVLGRDAIVAGRVDGDVTVIGGNLFMRPGGYVEGRAVAIGGGVYESSVAHIGAGSEEFRDVTYDVSPTPGGLALRYRRVREEGTPPTTLGVGFSTPSYDRSNGLSLGFGPELDLPRWSTSATARLVYRSQLGAWDPSVSASYAIGSRTIVRLDVRRGTFTNDGWIWPDLANSIETLAFGDDARNYYRGTRERLSLGWSVNQATSSLKPYVAVTHEHTGQVRPLFGAAGGPWSLTGRRDRDDMLRPNPPVGDGHMYSAHAGFQLDLSSAGTVAHAAVDEEIGAFSAVCGGCDIPASAAFTQTTIDGFIAFPAFLTHTVRFDAHAVFTSTGDVPPQRLVYLGGPATLPTLSMLAQGGDELLFVDSRYEIPVPGVALPLLGPPSVSLRSVVGGAALGRFPELTQLTGIRLAAGFLYADLMVDPATRHAHGSAGLSVGR